ncbi:tyrosine-type recombinase/integrase [Micromonospora sp. WMMA1363]|uniref:tyrosine-type recombinase/integrase n=1 Tax=Micromonospora sp. WMMA1363 TaxID=3053985 RepID=UPI00259D1BDE|nr:tyrosine-type recombinase/integrase [Micromonospora sp. WMMA1363]MDM4723360.1 tyrosine-type recombinase/integrase [Micromonospora sp. WMMA1363]
MTGPTTAATGAPAPRTPPAGQPPVLHGDVLAPPTADTGVPATGPARLDVDRWLAAHRPRPGADLARLRDLAADVATYAQASRATATRRKYDTGWKAFADWCAEFGFQAGPPAAVEVVALYLAQMGRDHLATSTMDGRLAAIRDRHLDAGLLPPTDDPRLRRIRDGVRRVRGRPAEGVDAIGLPMLAAMLATLPTDTPDPTTHLPQRRAHLAAIRDRCLLTVGFAAALRREELAGLPVDHLELRPEGLRLLVARSKADQTGGGRRVDLPEAPPQVAWLCPVRATLAWLDATGRRPHLHRPGRARTGAVPLLSGITAGARFRATALTDRHVARVVKTTATASGQRPEIVDQLAGHSLRAGFATTAEAAGVPRPVVDRVLGHSTGTGGRYVRHTFDGSAQQAVYGLAAQLHPADTAEVAPPCHDPPAN